VKDVNQWISGMEDLLIYISIDYEEKECFTCYKSERLVGGERGL